MAHGAERPLSEEPVNARHVHGQDCMSDNDWVRPDPRHAVELLRDILFETADPGDERLVTLVPLSPRPASPRAPMRRGKSGRLRGSTAQGSR